MVNLIQSRSQDTGTLAVKVGKRDLLLPKGEVTKVKCQVQFVPVPEGMPVIFEPNGDSELPEGLELGEEITKITPGTSGHVTILVRNNTERNILLKRRTELGRVHMVKSVYQPRTLRTKSTLKKRRNLISELPHIKVMNKMNGSHQFN